MIYPRFNVFEGVARGGPRDGIKLTASPGWDGVVYHPPRGSGKPAPYPGRYRFDYEANTWVWEAK